MANLRFWFAVFCHLDAFKGQRTAKFWPNARLGRDMLLYWIYGSNSPNESLG